jgi:multidrug resistance efflux pump
MNANELADNISLDNCRLDHADRKRIATMLRILAGQLAFRIDAVTKYQAKVEEQQAEIEALKAENSHLKYEISSGAWNPAELTDEEIKDLYMSMKALDQSNILIRFSRELLRKAQEKC